MRRVNLLVIGLLVAAPVAAEIYQWRDAKGQAHYSDTPPADVRAEPLRGSSAPAAAERRSAATGANAEPGAKTLADKEVEFRQRRAEAAEADAKAAAAREQADARRRDCERARNQLVALESGQRFARFNAAGEREVLDDAGRADEIAQTRSYIDAACK